MAKKRPVRKIILCKRGKFVSFVLGTQFVQRQAGARYSVLRLRWKGIRYCARVQRNLWWSEHVATISGLTGTEYSVPVSRFGLAEHFIRGPSRAKAQDNGMIALRCNMSGSYRDLGGVEEKYGTGQ